MSIRWEIQEVTIIKDEAKQMLEMMKQQNGITTRFINLMDHGYADNAGEKERKLPMLTKRDPITEHTMRSKIIFRYFVFFKFCAMDILETLGSASATNKSAACEPNRYVKLKSHPPVLSNGS